MFTTTITMIKKSKENNNDLHNEAKKKDLFFILVCHFHMNFVLP